MTKTIDDILYEIAIKVYDKKISKSEGVNKLANEYNFNRGSANMIIGQIFPKLISGQIFTRTLSVKTFDCFLKNILSDFGNDGLLIALSALKKHIDYIREKGDAKIKLREVYQGYLSIINSNSKSPNINENEQNEIIDFFNENNRTNLINELNKSIITKTETVTVKNKKYKRNNKIIALIKILRNYKCQICGISIIKKNGEKYVEAAHIIPKHKKGNETPENILLLCPNHHKEFDLGNRIIKKHNETIIEFVLNGKEHIINLTIN